MNIDKEEQKELWECLAYRMEEEGFYYCFKHYSNWEEIIDADFHKLRIAFLLFADQLENYVKTKVKENNELEM